MENPSLIIIGALIAWFFCKILIRTRKKYGVDDQNIFYMPHQIEDREKRMIWTLIFSMAACFLLGTFGIPK